jgi:hypothetical protein
MTTSINQPWAISENYSSRYGQIWTNLDFVFEQKISAENFKTDPMNCTMGTLSVAGQSISMRYKDLITYTKEIETYTNNMYASKPKKDHAFSLEIKGRTLLLVKHEIGKLNETLSDALNIAMRKYELGLYL